MSTVIDSAIETHAPIPTWFGVGGRADALARPGSAQELRELLGRYETVRVLGDGANLLVDDGGVDGLVVSLERLNTVREAARADDAVTVHAQAGVKLPKLITDTVRGGLGGLETLGGVPASVGGAVVMNAGGAFGQIGDRVERVYALTPAGEEVVLDRGAIDFGYRRSGLNDLLITGVDLRLTVGDPARLRAALKDVMAYKSGSQPMADRSAGCVFRNPTVKGARVSAGKLIDEAGCKGWTVRGARVSDVHANFIVVGPGAAAADVQRLIEQVRERVRADSGVELETEVVIWRRGGARA